MRPLRFEPLEERRLLAIITWSGGTSGTGTNFETASNWVGNVLPGPNDEAYIPPAFASQTITSATSITILSLVSEAGFQITGGTLTVGTTAEVDNAFTLSGGTLAGTTIKPGSGGQGLTATSSGGTLNGVTLDCNVALTAFNAYVVVTNGLTLNGTVTIGSSSSDAQNALEFAGSQTVLGNGTVVFGSGGYTALTLTQNNTTLTIGSGIIVHGGSSGTAGAQLGDSGASNTTIINQGTIDADAAGTSITIYPGGSGETFTNQGTIEATAGTLSVNGAWSNAGTLSESSATLNLGGSFTTAGIGNFTCTTGTVNLTGTLSNSSNTLALTAATGSWNLLGGTIVGGMVTETGGAQLAATSSGGTLNGVTLDCNVALTAFNAYVVVTNGLTLNGTVTIGSSSSDAQNALEFAGSQTVLGNGTVVFGSGGYTALTLTQNNTTLTIGSGIIVHGGSSGTAGAQLGDSGASNTTIINQGTIDADAAGTSITIYPGGSGETFTNQGTIEATAGTLSVNGAWSNAGTLSESSATLNLGGSFTTAGIGNFTCTTGTVNLTGTLSNSSNTLALTAATGSWNLLGGTIVGGMVTETGGAQLAATSSGGTLNGVTLDCNVALTAFNAYVVVTNGLTLNGTVTVGSSSSDAQNALEFAGSQTVLGNGTVVFGSGGYTALTLTQNNTTLTIGSGIIVHGGSSGTAGAQLGDSGASNTTIINQGTIDADAAGQTITVGAGVTWTNSGTLEAANAGNLDLSGTITTANLGTLESNGGTLNITGTLNNSGSTLVLTAATGSLTLSGTILAGTITASGGAALISTGGTLNGVTLAANLTVPSNSSLNVKNGLTLDTVNLMLNGYNPSSIYFQGTQTLGGTGQVVFGGSNGNNYVYAEGGNTVATAATLTIGPGITVQGTLGGNVTGYYSQDSIINQGTIDADASGQTITVGAGVTWTNSGTLECANGGILGIGGILNNSGQTLTLSASNGPVTLGSSGTIMGGTVTTAGGAALNVNGITLNGVTLGANLTVPSNSSLNVKNGLTLDTVNLMLNGYNPSSIYFQGTQTLGGTGQVVFGGSNGNNYVYAEGGNTVATAATLTIGPGITVQGTLGGNVTGYYSQDSIINQGTIDADASGQTITVGAGVTWTNSGTLEAANAGNLDLSGTITTANLGTLESNGGTLNITGTLNNSGSTLVLTAATGSLTLSGTILAGTITASGGAALISTGGTLNGVTLAANLTVPSNSSLNVKNGLTLDTVNLMLNGYNPSSIYFQGTQTLGGTGQVVFGGSNGNNYVYAEGGNTVATAATLTIGPGITVQGTLGGNVTGYYSQDSIINQGTIDADASGQTITVGAGVTWTNSGTLECANGGILGIGGILNNSGQTLTLSASNGPVTLGSSGTIMGGTVTTAGGAALNVNGITLNGVTLGANLTVPSNSSLNVKNGLTLDTVNLMLNGYNPSSIYFQGTQTLGGTGQVVFGGSNGNNYVYAEGGNTVAMAATLTIGPGITVQGTLGGNVTGYYSQDSIINQGTIDADASGQTITVGAGVTWTNSGTLEAANAGNLDLSGTITTANLGTLESNGGTLNITGTLNNSGSTLVLTAATGSLTLSGTILAGTITASGGAALISTGGTLNGVTLAANLTVPSNSSLNVKNGLTLDTVNLMLNGYNPSSIYFQGTQTLGGTGQVVFGGSNGNNYVYAEGGNTVATAATLTIGPGITVQGTLGGNVTGYYSQDSIINQGTIDADASGQTITVGAGVTWTNSGTLECANGGILGIGGILNNSGQTLTLSASNGPVTLGSSGTIMGGTVTTAGGAALNVNGITLNGVTLGANLTVPSNSSLNVKNGLTLDTVNLMLNGYNPSSIYFQGTQTLGGTGQVVFGGSNGNNYVYAEGGNTLATAATLTIGSGITVEGTEGGTLGGYYSQDSIINQGTIDADTSGQKITVGSTGTWTNSGAIQAQNGGTLTSSTTPTNYSSGTLTGGSWNIYGGSTLRIPLGSGITTDAATILLDGANSNFYNGTSGTTNALAALATIAAAGSFTVQDGRTFTTTGSLANSGTLNLGGTLDVTGAYTQAAGATLVEQIGGTQAGQFGSLAVTGAATLAGALGIDLTGGFQPGQYGSTSFLAAASVAGQFSSVTNVTPGSGYSFNAFYSATTVSVVVNVVPFVDLVLSQVQVNQGQGPSQLVAGLPGTVTWTVTNEGNTATSDGWHDAVYLSADGQIDGNAILLATEPEGTPSLAANGSYQASATFTVPLGQTPGSYSLIVDADYDQAQSESSYTNNLGTVSAAVLPPEPDLEVTGLAVSPFMGLLSGGTLTVNWNDTNSGLGAVTRSFSDRIEIVNNTTNQILLATGIVAYNEFTQGPLVPGGTVAQQYAIQLPNGAAGVGQWQVTVINDIFNQVTKFNADGTPEANSTASVTATSALAPYPDLHTTGLAVDSSSVLQSGGTVTVDWNDSNAGDATASGNWYDQVTVVNTTTGQTLVNTDQTYSGNSIAAGGATLRTYSFTQPNGAAGVGNLSITVTSDAGGNLPDYNSSGIPDANRSANTSAQSTLANYADLHATGVTVDPSSVLQSGGLVTIDWNDSNVGDGPASGSWYDQVTVVNTTTGQTLVNTSQTFSSNSISVGGTTPRSYSFTLPNGAAGVGHLSITVTADAGGNLPDYNSSGKIDTNRSASTTGQSTLGSYPDLHAAALAVAASSVLQSGGTVTVDWNDSNAGDATASGSWYDQVTVVNTSTGQTLVNTDQTYSGNSVTAGGTTPRTYSFTLPNGAAGVGNLSITVAADGGLSLLDYNSSGTLDTNRSANITAQSTLNSYPELAVESVAGPASVNPGQATTVAWTLANTGSAAANGSWSEQVFYGTDSTGDNLTLLTSSTYSSASSGALAAGASVPRSASVSIPASVVGNIWFVVKEDADGGVYENVTAASTGVATQATNVPPGLTLSLASQTVLKNAGAAATTGTATRSGNLTQALTVSIGDSNTNDTSVPASVTIPAGQVSATFTIGTIDDGLVDGNQAVTFTVSASGYAAGSRALTVQETDSATLTLAINNLTFSENAGSGAATATLTRDADLNAPLVVALTSNNINKLTIPASITIPAGQPSTTFALTAVNDKRIDGSTSVAVSASSMGFLPASQTVTVTDANTPTLGLSLADQSVSEAAGTSATTGAVKVPAALSVPLTLSLSSNNTDAATVPAHVVLPAGQTSVTFVIAAVNDGLDDGNKTAVITAQVETDAGVVLTQGAASADLLVVNANGPALSVAFAISAVQKGASTTATVTRNTATTAALVVQLSSSDPTKATVPATVTIPAGQTSVTFTVTAIDDHTPDGLQHVQITAGAATFASAIVPLGISDVDLPDLVVSSVTAPASGYDNAALAISWTVTNAGQYPASGSWLDDVYIDPAAGPQSAPQSSTPADTIAFNGIVDAGQSYTQTDTLEFPATVGQYVVRVVTDANQNIQELSYGNNTGVSSTVNDQATYHATVSTGVTTVPNGTPIPLSGLATLTKNGQPAANVPVAVQIMVGGTTRTLTATTDATGHYNLTFQPLENEAGQYSVAADDPGVTNPAVQAHFQIIGMSATPASANVTVVPNTPLTGQFTLTNLNGVALSGLSAAASGGPAGLSVQLTPPATIAANGTAALGYSLDETAAQSATGVVTIQVTSAQGTVLDILLSVSVVPLTPKLAANPGSLNTGMLVGSQSVLTFTVTNNGGAASGDLQVSLPSTSYMALGSPATIPSLAPGASSTVTIELDPPANLPLEQYVGTIGIGNGQTGLSVPFTFQATTTATGSVYVLVDDDYTFDEAGAPHVEGASVTLLNPYDNTQVVASGVTDATGSVTLTNVPAGPYALQITAPQHGSYQSSFTVLPGITNDDEVFIARQFVSYTWTVAQTTIQDTYQIQLQTNFQTNVPAPVVTITAPSAIPTLAPGQSASFNVTVTNHGLIAAQGVSLNLPTDPEYTFTALSDQIGVVPANSSVTVPITVTRSAPKPVSTDYGSGGVLTTEVEVPNPVGDHTESTLYVDYSNTGTAPMAAPLLVLTAAQGAAGAVTAQATQSGSEGAWLTLNPNLEASGYNTSAAPAGFSESVEILASGATPGILAPGESEQVPVYYVGWNLPDLLQVGAVAWTAAAPVQFSLTTISADNTTAANWSSLLTASQPTSVDAAAWATISANLAAQLGGTSGSYVQLLDSDAAYLRTLGENITDAGALWGFAVQQADNDLNPIGPYLTAATDVSLPTPGSLSLSFGRAFASTISGRDTMGPLGMGWSTNWQTSLSVGSDGTVTVSEPGGGQRIFQPNASVAGRYISQPGDTGTLAADGSGGYLLAEADGTQTDYRSSGLLNYVQDTDGNRITAGYTGGQLTSLAASSGQYLHIAYNAAGLIASVTDSTGRSTTYNYDASNTYLVSVNGWNGQTTNYTYNTTAGAAAQNALVTILNPGGTHEYFSYNSQGWLAGTSADGDTQPLSYAYSQGLVSVTDVHGNTSNYYYNEQGLLSKFVDPLANATQAGYDSNGNLTKLTDAVGQSETYSYNTASEVTSATDFLGNTTNFAYSGPFNELSSMTDANGDTTQYAYSSSGDLLSTTYPDGSSSSATFNPEGEATSFVDPNGRAINYTDNAAGEVTGASFSDGSQYTYTFDTHGNLLTATSLTTGTVTFTYDPVTEYLTKVAYPNGTWLAFTYNAAGQRTQMVDQSGFTTNYLYNTAGWLTGLTDANGTPIVTYEYCSCGRLTETLNGNGTYTTYSYDADDNITDLINYAPSGTVNSSFAYTFNALGLETSETTLQGVWTYGYDADGQLTSAVFASNNPAVVPNQNLAYSYDALGNRIVTVINGIATDYVANDMNQYTSVGGVAYKYDANGNLLSDGTNTYTYNSLNELTSVTNASGTTTYVYNSLGQRVASTLNGVTTQYLIDPAGLGNVVGTYSGSGIVTGANLTADYTYGLGLTSQVTAGGSTYYYSFDTLGNTVDMTNGSGATVNSYSYLPFGGSLSSSVTTANPFQFVGQFGVQTAGSGLSFMQARYYASSDGRFGSPDPLRLLGGDANFYRYVYNSPTEFVDPLGLCSCGVSLVKDGADLANSEVGLGAGFVENAAGHVLPEVAKRASAIAWRSGLLGIGSSIYDVATKKGNDRLLAGAGAGLGILGLVSLGAFGIAASFPLGVVAGVGGLGLSVYSLAKDLLPCSSTTPPPDPLGGGGGGNGGGDPGGNTTVNGPCTIEFVGYDFYVCDGNDVWTEYSGIMAVPGRDCSAPDVEHALAVIVGPGGPGGGVFVPITATGGGGRSGPSIVSTASCNPAITTMDQQTSGAQTDADDPPVNTAPLVIGTDEAANASGATGNTSPAAFIATALGNLGLITGQAGNAGYSPSDAAQVVGTIATFDQVEADLAGIVATADENGASLGIAGDINLLEQVAARLDAVSTAEDLLFGGDADWLDTKQVSTLQQWLTAFYADIQASSDGAIDAAAEAQLLATTLPSSVSISEATEFINRWNTTVQYWNEGIFTAAQVPAGQSTDLLDTGALQAAFNAALSAEQESQADGYTDPLAEVRAALTTTQNDLSQMGVCATVKLQIDQTATLTRSAFTGTLTLTNSETTGPMTNVVMNITITDSQGNPANGEFYVSSPTYSGAFSVSVVNGSATLPDNATGSITFTFIPDDTASSGAATIYDIGGTIGFTDPAGGNVSIPVFPATITVYPQPKLVLNYFLQRDVIGEDPSNPGENIPSEPAVLGLLVTNSGLGTANNLAITTGQPQIVQNQKGLADTFQIIGTQVDNQQESPSLDVDFGNVAPGQTADAEFLLTSTLQGVFTDFTASFTHTDALGGLDTSLISSVTTHTLIHAGDFQYAGDASYPGEISYLAEDNANPGNLPDTIYFSNGTTAAVNIATNVQSSAAATPDSYTVTANVTSGWDYVQLPDPGAGYTLYKVVRSDGTLIPVSDQAWTTDRIFDAAGNSEVDYQLHILDFDSTGSYTVYYKPSTAVAPAIASLQPISGMQSAAVSSVTVAFNEAINPATFNTGNLLLTLNPGAPGNLITSAVTIVQNSPDEFTIGNLAGLTAANGNYVLTVSAASVSDYFGDTGAGSASDSWTFAPSVPAVVSVGSGNPALRNTPLQTVEVVLSEPIVPSSFTTAALTLTVNPGAPGNLIDSAVTITEDSPTTYEIDGLQSLTAIPGDYVLTVSAAGLIDANGNSGVGALDETWTLNTTGPTVASISTSASSLLAVQSPRNTVVPTLYVSFSEPIVASSFTYQAITFNKDGLENLIGPGVTITEISPTQFEVGNFENLVAPIDGVYTFMVNAGGVEDLAGNSGTGSLSASWDLITAGPAAPANLAISPDTGVSNSDGITNVQDVTLTGSLSEPGLAVEVSDNGTTLGYATVTGTTFSESLTLLAGKNSLSVYAVDAAANVSPTTTFTAFYEGTPPVLTQPPTLPAQPLQPVGSVAIPFSEAVVPATFTAADIALTYNGQAVALSGLSISADATNRVFTISGLGPLNSSFGAYVLTISSAGVEDVAGNNATGSASASWSILGTPTITVSAPNETYTALPYVGATAAVTGNGGATISDGSLSLTYYAASNLTQALAGPPAAAGNYDVVAVFSGDAGYATASSPPARFTIEQAPLTVVGKSVSVPYGEPIPALTGSVSGLIGSDATSVVYSFTTAAAQGAAPGVYGISATASDPLGVLANYDITVVRAELTITPAVTTTSVVPTGSIYGQALTLTAVVSSTDTAAGTPSGMVQFEIGGVDVGSPTTVVKGTASIVVPGLNAANYQITAGYSSNTVDFSSGSGSRVLRVSPAPVLFSLQSNFDWLLAGQEVSVAIASTTATSNGMLLTPDGAVTFYEDGIMLASQSLGVVAGQDQAVLDTTMLGPGRHAITVGYTSASGNFAMASASPVLTEIVFPADATVLTVVNTSSDPTVNGSLPWAVAQADGSNVATVITFASAAGQAFATPQTITLEATLDVSDANSIGIDGPSVGVTLEGDYSQSRFPILSVAQGSGLSLQSVNIGTQSPGANGDLQVAGVVDVIGSVGNLGSALSVADGGTVGLGGQTVTVDTFTLTSGDLTDGNLSSGARTVLSGTLGANLAGSGGLVKQGTGAVVLNGSNSYSGGTTVLAGTLIAEGGASLPGGSSLMVGAGAGSLFGPGQAAAGADAAPTYVRLSSLTETEVGPETQSNTPSPRPWVHGARPLPRTGEGRPTPFPSPQTHVRLESLTYGPSLAAGQAGKPNVRQAGAVDAVLQAGDALVGNNRAAEMALWDWGSRLAESQANTSQDSANAVDAVMQELLKMQGAGS